MLTRYALGAEKRARVGGRQHVLLVVNGALYRGAAEVMRRVRVGTEMLGLSIGSPRTTGKHQSADGRTAKQQRSFERSERHLARMAATAADRTESVIPKFNFSTGV